jgi:hypothetical protein
MARTRATLMGVLQLATMESATGVLGYRLERS